MTVSGGMNGRPIVIDLKPVTPLSEIAKWNIT